MPRCRSTLRKISAVAASESRARALFGHIRCTFSKGTGAGAGAGGMRTIVLTASNGPPKRSSSKLARPSACIVAIGILTLNIDSTFADRSAARQTVRLDAYGTE